MALLYLCSHIDRGNIGNAKIEGMDKDIGLTSNQYNIASTIFFVPYIIFGMKIRALLCILLRLIHRRNPIKHCVKEDPSKLLVILHDGIMGNSHDPHGNRQKLRWDGRLSCISWSLRGKSYLPHRYPVGTNNLTIPKNLRRLVSSPVPYFSSPLGTLDTSFSSDLHCSTRRRHSRGL